jgi:hypothetical protein
VLEGNDVATELVPKCNQMVHHLASASSRSTNPMTGESPTLTDIRFQHRQNFAIKWLAFVCGFSRSLIS